MIKKILCVALLFFYFNSTAQKVSKDLLKEYEDTLMIMSKKIMFSKTQIEKEEANLSFKKTLKEVLSFKNSFKYPFDSLKTISRLYSPDKKFRIFNWFIHNEDSTYKYFALIQYKNTDTKKYQIIELIDKSKGMRNSENKKLDKKNWFGSLYYKIIHIKKKGTKYYTLLGWDGIDQYSTQKIIDVMYFKRKNEVFFGAPIFIKNKKKYNRFFIEYNQRTNISLKYIKENKKIIYDHLVPIKKELNGLNEYYVPDGTFDGFKYKNGRWFFEKDIRITNEN